MKKSVALLLLVLMVWYGVSLVNPPQPLPAGAPATAFSAERAQVHVERIASEPHPVGTEAHRRVRKYLMGTLDSLGLDPWLQSGISVRSGRGSASEVHNIIARIRGTDPGGTVMAMAHYDSAPNAPGAGDDASGVAAILESVRALLVDGRPKNDILIVLTDAEERGLFGAKLFVEEYEQLGEIDLVINLEARGSSGPSTLFETSSGNSDLIPAFVRSASHPVGNSILYTAYTMMPNDTDLSVTKDAGLPGLNFAIGEDHLNYHTMQDTPENLSPASLQHHGENLLPALHRFGNSSLAGGEAADLVYFNNLLGSVSWYPASWSLPLAVTLLILLLIQMIWQFRTGNLSFSAWAGSTLVFLLAVAGATLLTRFGFELMETLHPQYRWLAQGENYAHRWYLFAFSVLTLAVVITALTPLHRRWRRDGVLSAVYTVWTFLALVTAWFLPTAAYLFTWPALLGLAGWFAIGADRPSEAMGAEESDPMPWRTLLIILLSLVAAFGLVPSYIEQIQLMLTSQSLFIGMLLLALLGGLCWPLLQFLTAPRPWHSAGALLLGGLLLLGGAHLNSGFDSDRKKQNHLLYAGDLDSGSAWWVSSDPAPDEWTGQFLGTDPASGRPGSFLALSGSAYLHAAADSVANDPFALQELGAEDSLYRYRIRVPERAIVLSLAVPDGFLFRTLTIRGKQVLNGTENRRTFHFFGDFSQPVELEMEVTGDGVPLLHAEVVIPGLPEGTAATAEPRPPEMMPNPFALGDVTLWRKTFRLGDDTLSSD